MATRDAFLVNWVKSAYGMEMGLVPVLERQSTQVQNDPDLRRAIDEHLQKTRRHVELLRSRLQAMGEPYSAIQPSKPVASVYQVDGSDTDRTKQAELIDWVTESFEWASYRALKALAMELGDNETGQICDQILQDEMAMTYILDRRLPPQGRTAGTARESTGAQAATAAVQDTERLMRSNFDALNAHDLDRWDRDFASDFRGSAPGAPGELDRQQNRSYVQGYLTAFPDLHFDIERFITAGDYVVADWEATGTHRGPLVMANGTTIPPTNKTVHVKGATSFEFKDGKISRSRVVYDSADLLRQLNLLPWSATNAAGEPNRAFVHLEIPAQDPRAAGEFYHKMFGWDYEYMGEPMNYTTFKTGNVGGGFAQVNDVHRPGGSIPYVESKNIDDDLRRAGSLGARTVVPKTEIPGMGYYAIFADPTGNRFGLFSM